jgi:hypothetical protein
VGKRRKAFERRRSDSLMMIAPVGREQKGQCEHRISGRADSELLETIGSTGETERECPFTISCRCDGPVCTSNERLNVRPDGKIIEVLADYT